MKVLKEVQPSVEQLPLVLNDRAGVAVIRGAAGSGKTTSALLRLKQLCSVRASRRKRLDTPDPVRVLVLTYNRSLAGYIAELARTQIPGREEVSLQVSTFAKWSRAIVNGFAVIEAGEQEAIVAPLAKAIGLPLPFVIDELDYAIGRFGSGNIEEYPRRDRDGRGTKPRFEKQRFYDIVIEPYISKKKSESLSDWNDLAEAVLQVESTLYDIIIVDEAQDMSATQLKAIISRQASGASLTLVLDTVQRIYPRYYSWREIGLDASKFVMNARLTENQRNTRQIAQFALPLVSGMNRDENGELPSLLTTMQDGPLPEVFGGSFAEQTTRIVSYIQAIDTADASIGILHPKGHGWFNHLRTKLRESNISFVELSQKREWPTGSINVGLSTIHSAKGLEFDHVIVCGLTNDTVIANTDEDVQSTQNTRRLLAIAFGRARQSLLVCHDPKKRSPLIDFFDRSTYVETGKS